MLTTFTVSASLLVALLAFRRYECMRGLCYGAHVRDLLDRGITAASSGLRAGARGSVEYVKRDVLMRGLHMVTYTALILVRFVERKLVSITQFLRQLRKPGQKREQPTLHAVKRSDREPATETEEHTPE